MGQYHVLVNRDACEHVCSHTLGSGLKAWEQTAGAVPAALAFLLSVRPGNAPGDVGNHRLCGHWAGDRILAVGDYAGKGDIPGFGHHPPLHRLYARCTDEPELDADREAYTGTKTTSDGRLVRRIITPTMQYQSELREFRRLTRHHKNLPNIGMELQGPLEHALSVRFCRTGHNTYYPVPVKARATGKDDGTLHYELPERLLRPQTGDDKWELGVIWRMTGLGGWSNHPEPDPLTLPDDLARWPWDRAPRDMSFRNASDADQDLGQERVFANLDQQEFFDPRVFGEVPTTLGIMRAASGIKPPSVPDAVIAAGGIACTPKLSADCAFSSAGCLWALLLHPEPRGGGDIEPEEFPWIGHWRHQRLILSSEYEDPSNRFPSTRQIRESFSDISPEVFASAQAAVRALQSG
jgi:hypothetical protein